mmetsp:Transcript_28894/g.41176  ORF Transcript_28894/g.41176 Transcript_28894/m.41176 type:complete len:578 (-) Transcript_28894:42-1775(-)
MSSIEIFLIILLVVFINSNNGFHNIIGKKKITAPIALQSKLRSNGEENLINQYEQELSALLGSVRQRRDVVESKTGEETDVNKIVNFLEAFSAKNQDNNKNRKLSDGCWKLVYTSSPGTNSPIQRTFTAIEKVAIFQYVNVADASQSFLTGKDNSKLPDVSNIVCFFLGENKTPIARLRVTALASTVEQPLVTPRKGDGKIFGLNIFGVSKSTPPRNAEERIDFAFQEALFEFRDLPFTIPYPVPFKLLGDEAKGWIDNTYVSQKFRIARGNKGTLFLLERVDASVDPAAAFAVSKQTNKKIALPSFINKKQKKKRRVAIIFPAQLSTEDDYLELSETIEKLSQSTIKCYPTPLKRFDWPIGLIPSFFSKEYITGTLKPTEALSFYLKKVDEAVSSAMKELGDDSMDAELILVGHSIGGWIARAWLSEWSDSSIRSKVTTLITLGSPHQSPPSKSMFVKFDQTRGLLNHINLNYPGAHESGVSYYSVIGNQVAGDLNVFNPESLLAYFSYIFLAGDGKVAGDGIIPIETSTLTGATDVVIEGIRHSNFVPTITDSIKLPVQWYGSDDAVNQWLKYIL